MSDREGVKKLETALRHAAEKLVEEDSTLHASSPDEKWNRYTEAILKLRSVLVDSHDEEVKAWAKRLAEEIQLRESCNRLLGDQAEEILRIQGEIARVREAAQAALSFYRVNRERTEHGQLAFDRLRAALDASPPKPDNESEK
jgi:hypothetical protein